jgi:hypothetical protein
MQILVEPPLHPYYVGNESRRLPRPWPLLREGQDPASLEARVAFHLHRMKLVGRALHQAGYHNADAADLAAARTLISQSFLEELARRLGVSAAELSRPLTPDEQREWAFYRASAADPSYVWNAARSAWTAKGLSETAAAAIMGLNRTTVAHAVVRSHVLTFKSALRLSTALSLPGGPEAFLPLPTRDDPQQSR